MKRLQIFLVLMIFTVLATGCAYNIRRSRIITQTTPSNIVVTGQDGNPVTPIVSGDKKMIGRFWNNSQFPIAIHLPNDFEVCKGCQKKDDFADNAQGNWYWAELLVMKPGDKSPWIRVNGGKIHYLNYDYTSGQHVYRSWLYLAVDFAPSDSMYRGDIVDWYWQFGPTNVNY